MRKFPPPLPLLVLVFSPFCHNSVCGVQVNRTIDDTFGDSTTGRLVTYTPPVTSVPLSRWVDQTCQECEVLPGDPTKAFNGTFHGASYNPALDAPVSFQLDFTGTAIYVFFTIVNNVNTFVNFTVDNTPNGSFTYAANAVLATRYQVPVFSHNNLQDSQHSLVVSTSPSSAISYINFDYALYTQDDGFPGPAPPSSSGTVFPLSTDPSTQPSPSPSALSSKKHPRSRNTSFSDSLSRASSTSVQPPATIATVPDTTPIVSPGPTANAAPTPSSTPGPIIAAPQTRPTRLAIAGAVLGPLALVAAAGLLFRYILSRNQATLKEQDPIPFTEAFPIDPSFQDADIFVPISKRKSHSKISALLSEKVRDALRRTRLEDIDQRLRAIRGEIVEISSKLSARGAMVQENGSRSAQQSTTEPGDNSVSSRRLRRMLDTKRRQIEHVEQQRQSPWALGLSEESPF